MPADGNAPGDNRIFADSSAPLPIDKPFADGSKVFVSYRDGSVFSGNNDLVDANLPFLARCHYRRIRDLTAALDLARATCIPIQSRSRSRASVPEITVPPNDQGPYFRL